MVYNLAIAWGVGYFIYIYIFSFDALSEDELVKLAQLWLLPFVFGLHGLVAGNLLKAVAEGKFPGLRRAVVEKSRNYGIFGPLGQLIFFPLILAEPKRPITAALLGAGFWGVLLAVFIQFVFPAL